MGKFRQSNAKEVPAISASSLPDIVFMLLFFFMVSTSMRDVTLLVKVHVPEATEVTKLEKKSLVSYIYVGVPVPQYQRIYGTEPRVQLNDKFAKVEDIPDYIEAERQARDEAEIPLMITSIKGDEFAKMGIITEIKQELRRAAALHINYSARRAAVKD